MKTICVCGGRNFNDKRYLFHKLDLMWVSVPGDVLIINGGARGADQLSTEWAKFRGVEWLEFPADWVKYGRAAGHIRNKEMIVWGFDLLIAFPGGVGTKNMVAESRKAGRLVLEL